VLPKYDTSTVWEASATVETMTSFRAVHGGGYQFRLCPLELNLTEACFQKTPMPFVGNSKLMISEGSTIELNSMDVSNGTLPVASRDVADVGDPRHAVLLPPEFIGGMLGIRLDMRCCWRLGI
jgi:hypothetical protein